MWTNDPERIELKSGGGLLMVFGLPFFAAGVGMLSVYFGGVEIEDDAWVAALVGIIFALVGAAIMFGRAAVIIDKRQGTLQRWWGLLVPWVRKSQPLSDFEMVETSLRVIRSKNSTRTVYPVTLVGPAAKVTLRQPGSATESRKLAERVANFLTLGVRDTTGQEPVTREAGHLDEPIRDRLMREGVVANWPEPPADTRLGYERIGDAAALTLPAEGFTTKALIPLVVTAGMAVFIGAFFLWPLWSEFGEGRGPGVLLLIIGLVFAGAPLLVGIGAALQMSRTWERVTISPSELRVERIGPLGSKRWTLRVDALEGLTCDASEGAVMSRRSQAAGQAAIVAESDADRVVFGRTVSGADRQWVHDAIRYVICGGEPL